MALLAKHRWSPALPATVAVLATNVTVHSGHGQPQNTMSPTETMNPREIQQQIDVLTTVTSPGTSMITILCAAGRDLV